MLSESRSKVPLSHLSSPVVGAPTFRMSPKQITIINQNLLDDTGFSSKLPYLQGILLAIVELIFQNLKVGGDK